MLGVVVGWWHLDLSMTFAPPQPQYDIMIYVIILHYVTIMCMYICTYVYIYIYII